MIRKRLSLHFFLHILLLIFPPSSQYDATLEAALNAVHSVSSNARGTLCVTRPWLRLPARLHTTLYRCASEQALLAAAVLAPLAPAPPQELLDAVPAGLVRSVKRAVGARVLHLSESQPSSEPQVLRASFIPTKEMEHERQAPWWDAIKVDNWTQLADDEVREENDWNRIGRWSKPYFSCRERKWLLSYTVLLPGNPSESESMVLSVDIDVSNLEMNQCNEFSTEDPTNRALQEPLSDFLGSHKCPKDTTQCVHRPGKGWSRGSYTCKCRDGFYSLSHPQGFNGSLMEIAWQEHNSSRYNQSSEDWKTLGCVPCAEGCITCTGPEPCMASYGWEFRTFLLCISIWCATGTFVLSVFLYRHRRARVFRSASPIFLAITLLGCVIMYFEMLAIYPVLDMYSCIATKWCRHLGFCITYTALLMKTWRVSLTYRVKSAHAVKLTERQLLRWLLPVLLVMLVYLGTWTLSDPPHAEDITDSEGLIFKQCTYNWWDHSLALGELAFLLWGVRVCYGVRHAESLYNEARLISYAIYNIAAVNCLMVTFHLLIFPRVGPDMKYFLGFLRTQLSTTVTVAVVFGPKVVLIWRGFGDQWDSKATRGVSASFSLNGIGSIHPRMPPTPHDLAQENDELKEEVQKLAAQIEFMKIVQMELHNRHLRPKPGGHFTMPPSHHNQQGMDDIEKDFIIRPG